MNRALVLLWAALAIAGISVFASFHEVRGEEFSPVVAIITVLLFAANAALIWLIGRRRNWARIVMLILVVVMIPFLFFGDWQDDTSLVDILVEWFSSMLELLAMYLLFSGNSGAWFRQSGENTVSAP